MEQIIMDGGSAIYIIGAILATIQAVSAVFIYYLRRAVTKAEAKNIEAQAASETADASQTTATAFSTLTQTISQLGTEYSNNLTKIAGESITASIKFIDLLDTREKKIDDLEGANRRLLGDVDDFKRQFSDMAALGAKQDTEIEQLRDSVKTLKLGNGNLANELFDVKQELAKLRLESTQKDAAIQERDLQIAEMKEIDAKQKERIAELESNRDARIIELENKVSHLEAELVLLKQAATPVEVVTIEVKKDGVNPT